MSRSTVPPRFLRSTSLLATALLLGVAACRDGTAPGTPPRHEGASATAQVTPLDTTFANAAREFGVPADLLKAIAFTETRVQMVDGQQEFDGVAPAKGVMALRGENLRLGAALAGVTVTAASHDATANVRSAAALLDSWAKASAFDRADLAAWAPLVARYSGIAAADGQASYVQQEVFKVLNTGLRLDAGTGITIAPRTVSARFAPAPRPSFSADYAPAVWRPSPNYNARPAGDIGKVGMIVIHTCEGTYSSCWSWLTNSASGVSAHYVVNESGSEISQLVLESNRGWHVGASYDCTLNSSVECWRNGYSVNHFSVGIEHGGYASQSSFPVGQVDASAKLSCDISKGHAIPRDKYHVIAHGQLQPASRTDPGPNWPWTDYLNRINSHCASSAIIIDSHNPNNNTAVGYSQVSANWTSSSGTAGYYGSGYYHATTAAVSDPATFWFYMPAAGTRTIDAWWTAGTNRSTTAPFVMWNAAGTQLGTANVNQTINGGKWNTLGTYNFTAGWNKVQLSRWTTAGTVVIADAVRVR